MTYSYDSLVNRKEVETLKELIFRRVRERAERANAEEQTDLLDIARESLTNKGNPFVDIANYEPKEKVEEVAEKTVDTRDKDVGFAQRISEKEVKTTELQNQKIKNEISAKVVVDNMVEARDGLYNKTTFMGALNFLNSQAAASLIRTKTNKFEFLA